MNSRDTSPSEFELDSYATAWDAAPSRKVRRHYGKTNIQKKEARKALRGDRCARRTELDLEDSDELSLTPTFDRSSSSCDLQNTIPALPPRSGLHIRSNSVTGVIAPRVHQTMQRHHSFSALSTPSIRYRPFNSMSSGFLHEHENIDPNVMSQHLICESAFDSPLAPSGKVRPPLSVMDEHPKARPRKIRALSNLGDLQRSFSDLAKEADAVQCWDDATPQSCTSIAFDLADLETSSIHGSMSTISSRKRSVSDSAGGDDLHSDVSSQGGGAARVSKSRSRIYSTDFAPMLESVRSLNDMPSKKVQCRKQSYIDSDDGGENDSDDGMPSMDKSFDCEELNNQELIQVGVAHPPRTFHPSSSDNFDEFIFGAASALGTKKLSNEGITQSMPSLEDLSFMIKSLRKSKKGAIATFGMASTWTVPLPNQWVSDRRTKVLHWSTHELGFSMRTGGPAVVFLNIAASKGPVLLSSLESAFVFYQDRNPRSIIEKPLEAPSPVGFCEAPAPHRSRTFRPRGFREPSASDSRDDDLVQALKDVKLTDADPLPPKTVKDTKVFVRAVTLETNLDFHCAQPRHSGDYLMAGNDLVNHMHVASPRVCRGRLSSNSRPSTARRPRLLVDTDFRSNAISSPFVQGSNAPYEHHVVEGLETPHMTRRACWERTKIGRDWGASSRCNFEILCQLSERFEHALLIDGHHLEDSSSSGFGPSLIPFTVGTSLGMDEVDEESDSESTNHAENFDAFDDFDFIPDAPPREGNRRISVGATAFADLHLDEMGELNDDERAIRRRLDSIAKHKRVSLCASALQIRKTIHPSRVSYFSNVPRLSALQSTLTLTDSDRFSFLPRSTSSGEIQEPNREGKILSDSKILAIIFSFLDEKELLCRSLPVCTLWADASTEAHAALLILSVGFVDTDGGDDGLHDNGEESISTTSVSASMERSWKYLVSQYPHACYLAGGAFKNVYKVFNNSTQSYEAMSVMDVEMIESTGNKHVVAAELAVSAMLSSLVRRNICPNFVVTRRVFTCQYEPPKLFWGSEENKQPMGSRYSPRQCGARKPREPHMKHRSRYQYMRMELCSEGDAENFLKRQPEESISPSTARKLIFQIAFALHAAADRFSLKHYDIKLLNIFLQNISGVDSELITLKYGLGSHTFAVQMPTATALIAKVADYGTANIQAEFNGQPATIGQFTTLENTPPEFMIVGDAATQGHGHDAFGLGLCMLHLFTGHAPYEELLADVKCPSGLKAKLQGIWEDENTSGYSVIRSVILADVFKDDTGIIIEGEADGTLYDTLYRFLVLFGIPERKYKMKSYRKVWKAISSSLDGEYKGRGYGRDTSTKKGSDSVQFNDDQQEFSLRFGHNPFISRARKGLEQVPGGLDLLLSLVDFDPEKRATVCDVLNSQFMIPLREDKLQVRTFEGNPSNHVISFMTYATT